MKTHQAEEICPGVREGEREGGPGWVGGKEASAPAGDVPLREVGEWPVKGWTAGWGGENGQGHVDIWRFLELPNKLELDG